MPAAAASSMAVFIEDEYPPPPHEFEVRSTPIFVAYAMDLIPSERYPPPDPPRNLSPTIETFQLTPTTPLPLFPTAPIVPAQCVPCELSSCGLLSLL